MKQSEIYCCCFPLCMQLDLTLLLIDFTYPFFDVRGGSCLFMPKICNFQYPVYDLTINQYPVSHLPYT